MDTNQAEAGKKESKSGRRSLSLEQKYQIAERLKGGMKQREASRLFNVSLGTVNRIFKTQHTVVAQYHQSLYSARRPQIRRKTPKYEAINDAVYKWYRDQIQGAGLSIPTGTEIQRKAREVAASQYPEAKDFGASNGWLYSWRKMYNISPHSTATQLPPLPPLPRLADLSEAKIEVDKEKTIKVENGEMTNNLEENKVMEQASASTKITETNEKNEEVKTEEVLDALDLLEKVCTKRFKGKLGEHFTQFRTTIQAAMIRESLFGSEANYDDMKISSKKRETISGI